MSVLTHTAHMADLSQIRGQPELTLAKPQPCFAGTLPVGVLGAHHAACKYKACHSAVRTALSTAAGVLLYAGRLCTLGPMPTASSSPGTPPVVLARGPQPLMPR